jgi:quinol monooxygenase YgiN
MQTEPQQEKESMEGCNREAGVLEYPPSPTAAAEASVFAEVYPTLAAPKATRATPDKMAVKKLRRTGWNVGRMPEDQ